jgi:hypothetical protein
VYTAEAGGSSKPKEKKKARDGRNLNRSTVTTAGHLGSAVPETD